MLAAPDMDPGAEIHCCNPITHVKYWSELSQILKLISDVFEWSDLNDITYLELYHLILQHTDCNENEAFCVANILYPPISIEDLVNDEQNELLIAEEDNSLEGVIDSISYKPVRDAINKLSEFERNVIIHRFGLNGDTELTLEEIGKFYGLSRERIRQILSNAIKKIAFCLRKCGICQEM